ncbi:MAG TPA: acyltransferase [Vicinamibacterales bacterium]|jgi:acetyltransferase-like isoleucine patch superfamily enzyme|nr:acyltransferase [Vicinamibacterales bacterium]
MRDALKLTAHVLATIAISPALLSYYVRAQVLGPDRALEGSTQALAWLPGLLGVYLRRAFLTWTIASCDRRASVHFGTLLSQTGARLDANVYVGPNCHLGLVHLERDVLLAAGVHVPSGAKTHGTDDVDTPIREQEASRSLVRIGEGSWIGSGAVVLADVGKHSVVGAGSVVTKPIPDFVVAAGVPARVIRSRIEESARNPQG